MRIDIPSLIDAAGGEIVGKVRLQKMVYLLQQIGVPSSYSFEYHHYGPYSEQLAEALDDDVIFHRVSSEVRRRRDGVAYAAFSLKEAIDPTNRAVLAPFDEQIKMLDGQSSTVLELAATIHWLRAVEGYEDWGNELVRRKGVKTEDGRKEKAEQLLSDLGIEL